jgi:hypothetical protein
LPFGFIHCGPVLPGRAKVVNLGVFLAVLGVVFPGQQAVPTPLHPPQEPRHPGATALPGPIQSHLQEVRPLADAGRAGCPHCCGGEAAEPTTVKSVGAADRAAALSSEGLRRCKSESQVVKGQNCPATAATSESYTINLGYAPDTHRSPTVCGRSRQGRGEWEVGVWNAE